MSSEFKPKVEDIAFQLALHDCEAALSPGHLWPPTEQATIEFAGQQLTRHDIALMFYHKHFASLIQRARVAFEHGDSNIIPFPERKPND